MRKLNEKIKDDDPSGKMPIDIGVCGLHVVNGAIKCALEAAKWDSDSFLRDTYFIFNDSPVRRAEFTSLAGKTLYPLKHCATRWLENAPSIDRILTIFEDTRKFLDSRNSLNTKPLKKCFNTNK